MASAFRGIGIGIGIGIGGKFMWKILIVDDEPKIRKGLKNLLMSYDKLDMEVVGEAEDGEIAFEMAKNLKPDVILVDINMPFINGLQLIEMLEEILPDVISIIVTGHDEFPYAQKAVRLRVFDYIIKPITGEQLLSVMERARDEIVQNCMNNKYEDSSNKVKKENLEALKEKLFNDLIGASLSEDLINQQQKQLGIKLEYPSEMFVITVAEKYSATGPSREWDGQLLLFSIKKIVEDLLRISVQNIVFRDNKLNVIAIAPLTSITNVDKFCSELLNVVEENIGQRIIIVHKTILNSCDEIYSIYRELIKETEKEKNRSPVVTLCKKYIDENYYKMDLSLQDIANAFQVNPAYLSRLIKQNLGLTFIDYLSMVRINTAVKMMKDPMIKIYEISNTVGYSNQHYFSTAFKKVMGVSPGEYRKGGISS